MYAAGVVDLIQREPWRAGQGQPHSILEPGWEQDPISCIGDVEFELGGKWWWCKICGYCSSLSSTRHHVPLHPQVNYEQAMRYFFARRKEQGLTEQQAMEQALHVMGAALRGAASLPPNELARYVDEHILLE